MADPMRIRAKMEGDKTVVRVLMSHEMETGQRKDSAGKTIPAHFIQQVTATHNSPLTLHLADGSSVVIDGYTNNGDLGITLKDTPTAPIITYTITGDLVPTDFDPSKAGIQARHAPGDLIGTAGPYEDIITGVATTDSADHVISGALNDDIDTRGGDDWIEAGSDNDYVNGGDGADLIEGGTQRDILMGEQGDDRLYADTQIATPTAILNGNTDTASNQKGDWLAGGTGDDTLVSGADNDVLSGGGGNDLLIAVLLLGVNHIAMDGKGRPAGTDWSPP